MKVQTPLPDALTAMTDALINGNGEADLRRAAHNAPAEAMTYAPMIRSMAHAYTPVDPSADFMRDLKTELLTGKKRPVRRGKPKAALVLPRIHPTGWAFAGGFATLGVVLLVLRGLGALVAARNPQSPLSRPSSAP